MEQRRQTKYIKFTTLIPMEFPIDFDNEQIENVLYEAPKQYLIEALSKINDEEYKFIEIEVV